MGYNCFVNEVLKQKIQVLPKNSKIKINGNNCMSEIKLIIGDGNEFSKKIENKENEFQK